MKNEQKQTITLNLAIDLDLTQLAGFLQQHLPTASSLPAMIEPALTLQEAAQLLSCSDQKVRDLVNQGEIPSDCAFRVGTLYRFHRQQLMNWLHRSAARPA